MKILGYLTALSLVTGLPLWASLAFAQHFALDNTLFWLCGSVGATAGQVLGRFVLSAADTSQ